MYDSITHSFLLFCLGGLLLLLFVYYLIERWGNKVLQEENYKLRKDFALAILRNTEHLRRLEEEIDNIKDITQNTDAKNTAEMAFDAVYTAPMGDDGTTVRAAMDVAVQAAYETYRHTSGW